MSIMPKIIREQVAWCATNGNTSIKGLFRVVSAPKASTEGPSPPKPSSQERSKSAISGDLEIDFETHELTTCFDGSNGSNDKRGESSKRPPPRLPVVTRKDSHSSSAISTIPPRGNPRTANSPAKTHTSAESVPVDNPPPFAALMTDEEREKKEEYSNLGTCYTVVDQGCFQHLPKYNDELPLPSSLHADLFWWQSQQLYLFNVDAMNGVVINNNNNNNNHNNNNNNNHNNNNNNNSFEYHYIQTSANPAFSQLHLLTDVSLNHNFDQYTWAGS
ncbi:hypothetical protein RBB50_012438 [Rhinocladiella similis]